MYNVFNEIAICVFSVFSASSETSRRLWYADVSQNGWPRGLLATLTGRIIKIKKIADEYWVGLGKVQWFCGPRDPSQMTNPGWIAIMSEKSHYINYRICILTYTTMTMVHFQFIHPNTDVKTIVFHISNDNNID